MEYNILYHFEPTDITGQCVRGYLSQGYRIIKAFHREYILMMQIETGLRVRINLSNHGLREYR